MTHEGARNSILGMVSGGVTATRANGTPWLSGVRACYDPSTMRRTRVPQTNSAVTACNQKQFFASLHCFLLPSRSQPKAALGLQVSAIASRTLFAQPREGSLLCRMLRHLPAGTSVPAFPFPRRCLIKCDNNRVWMDGAPGESSVL